MTTKPKNPATPIPDDDDFLTDIDALIDSIDASIEKMNEAFADDAAHDEEEEEDGQP